MNLNRKTTLVLSISMTVSILLMIALGYAVYRYQNMRSFMREEKRIITQDLDEMIETYNTVLSQKDSLNGQLWEERDRVQSIRDSLAYLDATLDLVRRYRRQVRLLKKQKRELFRVADSLDRMNQILISQRNEIETRFVKEREITEGLKSKNEKLIEKVQAVQKLKIKDIRADAIVVEEDGAVVETTRARLATKIRICMTFSENQFVKPERKSVYVVIVTPEERILGNASQGQLFAVKGEGDRGYSAKRDIMYEKEELEACVYVEGSRAELVKGVYLCAVYVDGQFVEEAEIKLN